MELEDITDKVYHLLDEHHGDFCTNLLGTVNDEGQLDLDQRGSLFNKFYLLRFLDEVYQFDACCTLVRAGELGGRGTVGGVFNVLRAKAVLLDQGYNAQLSDTLDTYAKKHADVFRMPAIRPDPFIARIVDEALIRRCRAKDTARLRKDVQARMESASSLTLQGNEVVFAGHVNGNEVAYRAFRDATDYANPFFVGNMISNDFPSKWVLREFATHKTGVYGPDEFALYASIMEVRIPMYHHAWDKQDLDEFQRRIGSEDVNLLTDASELVRAELNGFPFLVAYGNVVEPRRASNMGDHVDELVNPTGELAKQAFIRMERECVDLAITGHSRHPFILEKDGDNIRRVNLGGFPHGVPFEEGKQYLISGGNIGKPTPGMKGKGWFVRLYVQDTPSLLFEPFDYDWWSCLASLPEGNTFKNIQRRERVIKGY